MRYIRDGESIEINPSKSSRSVTETRKTCASNDFHGFVKHSLDIVHLVSTLKSSSETLKRIFVQYPKYVV